MQARGIFAGLPVPQALAGHDRGLLVAVTELRSDADFAAWEQAARAVLPELA